MGDRLSRLIDVKSIVTIVVILGYVYMTIRGIEIPEPYQTLVNFIVAFFFGTQFSKVQSYINGERP